MDADLFLQKFGHLAQGEGGIKKLRDIILQLAVSGKLVEQNPADEPAEALLRKIVSKKESLIGKAKAKNTHRTLPNDVIQEIPSSWVHSTLSEIGVINPRNNFEDDVIAGFVPMTLVPHKYGDYPKFEEKKWGEIKKGYTHFANGDVGLAKITPCFENGKSCVFLDLPNGAGSGTTELHIFRDVTKAIVPEYVWIWIKSPEFLLEGEKRMTGSAGQKRVPKDYFALKPFPLPPLAEQKRIVAKVSELMALCDLLESEQKKQSKLKMQAVQSTLHHLTSAESPTSLGSSLNILECTFGNWFDDLATVKHLRATILELAVQGKLIPQNPNDQPVDEESDIEAMFVTPESWRWVSLKSITDKIGSGSTPRGGHKAYSKDGIPFLRSQNVWNHGLELKNVAFISEPTHEKMKGTCVIPSDVLLNITGASIGRCAKVPSTIKEANVSQHVSIIRLTNILYRDFIHLLLIAPSYQELIMNVQVGMSREGLSKGRLEKFAIPLPPLAEQKRIVAKVDELMMLCDQLESQITKSKTLNSQLFDSILHHTFKEAA